MTYVGGTQKGLEFSSPSGGDQFISADAVSVSDTSILFSSPSGGDQFISNENNIRSIKDHDRFRLLLAEISSYQQRTTKRPKQFTSFRLLLAEISSYHA